MEEVMEKLDNAFTSLEVKPESKNGFQDMYKNVGKIGNQEERRKELLETQKRNRNENVDKKRGILDLVQAAEEKSYSYKTYYRPSIYVAGFSKISSTYNNVLMLSEWLIEKPEDFSENWLVVPCPKGYRLLVVANRGRTKCYSKFGQFQFEKQTALPGGNSFDSKQLKNQCTVLDCFYQKKNNTMYILDLLVWKTAPMTDGETEFRHYWLKSQLDEMPDLKLITKKNEVIFTLLPKISCSSVSFNQFMMSYPVFECNFPPLDGLLFYHKQAQYVSGETPLVGWLFPYMVQEVLGAEITVHNSFLIEKPDEYINQKDFIEKFEQKYAKNKKRLSSCSSNMETNDVPLKQEPSNETKHLKEEKVEQKIDDSADFDEISKLISMEAEDQCALEADIAANN